MYIKVIAIYIRIIVIRTRPLMSIDKNYDLKNIYKNKCSESPHEKDKLLKPKLLYLFSLGLNKNIYFNYKFTEVLYQEWDLIRKFFRPSFSSYVTTRPPIQLIRSPWKTENASGVT